MCVCGSSVEDLLYDVCEASLNCRKLMVLKDVGMAGRCGVWIVIVVCAIPTHSWNVHSFFSCKGVKVLAFHHCYASS